MGAASRIACALMLLLAGCDRVPGTPQYAARRALDDVLFDPPAARVDYLHVRRGAVCGRVNGKTRYGAYAGAQPFVFANSSARIYPADASARADDACRFILDWQAECAGLPLVVERPLQEACHGVTRDELADALAKTARYGPRD